MSNFAVCMPLIIFQVLFMTAEQNNIHDKYGKLERLGQYDTTLTGNTRLMANIELIMLCKVSDRSDGPLFLLFIISLSSHLHPLSFQLSLFSIPWNPFLSLFFSSVRQHISSAWRITNSHIPTLSLFIGWVISPSSFNKKNTNRWVFF